MEKVQTARVIEFYSNSCMVRLGDINIPCLTPKRLDVVVGDEVEIDVINDSSEIKGKIVKRHKRRSALKRFLKGSVKTYAANLTHIGIICSPIPETPRRFIDKWLVLANASNLSSFIVANKSDQTYSKDYSGKLDLYETLGVNIVEISAKEGGGIEKLKNFIAMKSTIFVGKSGAGKSTITSKLTGKSLKTQSLKKSRGLHTTSISSLYSVEKNIEIIDSPGTRDLDISNIKKIDILSAFWEINEASKNCKFSDCRHIDEKNCAVQLGLKTNKIATSRYNNFLDFINNE